MLEDSLRKLFGNDLISKNLPQIIETFVAFYGKEEREFITERFNNTLILPFMNTDSLEMILEDAKLGLATQVLGENEFVNYTFEYQTCPDDFYEALVERDESVIEKIIDQAKEVFFKGETDISVIMNKIRHDEYPMINEFIRRYSDLKEQLKPFEERLKSERNKSSELFDKYYSMLIEEFKYLFSKEDLETYERTGIPTKLMRYYLGSGLTAKPMCFDIKSELSLTIETGLAPHIRNEIIKNRISFLKEMGIKLEGFDPLNEPTYEEYMKDEKVKEIVQKALRESLKIWARKKELNKQRKQEMVYSLEDYKKNKAIVDSHDYVDKCIPIKTYLYTNRVSLFSPNYTLKDGQYVTTPIVTINLGSSDVDATIFHELNHAFEYHTYSVDEKGAYGISGWDEGYEEFSSEYEDEVPDDDEENRPQELLSEFINERIIQEITSLHHSRGCFIYSMKRDYHSSVYMAMEVLLEEFYKRFKSIIIKSRSHGRFKYLKDTLGEENYNALNDLTNRFIRRFGFDSSDENDSYLFEADSEESKAMDSMIQERDQILSKMEEYLDPNKTQIAV